MITGGSQTVTSAPALQGQTVTVVNGGNGAGDDTALRTGGLQRTETNSTLILAGNNSYQGRTIIAADSTLQIGNDDATGSLDTVEIIIVRNSEHNWREAGGALSPSLDEIVARTASFLKQQLDKTPSK